MKAFKLVVALLLAGCAAAPPPQPAVVKVTYYSEPAGAMIYERDRQLGYAPLIVSYTLTDADRVQRYKKVQPTRAIWSSGATASLSVQPTVDLSKGYSAQTKFVRPVGMPGLDTDLRVAAEMERLQQQRRARMQAERVQAQQQAGEQQKADNEVLNILIGGIASGITAAAESRSKESLPPPPPVPSIMTPKERYRCKGDGFGTTECTQQ